MEDIIYREWQKLANNEPVDKGILGVIIYDSWNRCLQNSLNPNNLEIKKINSYELNKIKQAKADLLSTAIPVMRKLFEFIRGSGSVVVLTDENGIALDSFGDPEFESEILVAKPGTSWNETQLGTNGAGTALELRRPIQIYGSEHFYRENHIFSCSASPIHDPVGKIIGCIDISSRKANIHKHTLGMVVAASYSIEQQLLLKQTYKEKRLQYEKQKAIIELVNQGLFAIDGDYKITAINKQAEKEMHLVREDVLNKDIRQIVTDGIAFHTLTRMRENLFDKETILKVGNIMVGCNLNIGILKDNGVFLGAVFTYKTKARINTVVNKVTGSKAYFNFSDLIGKSKEMQSCIELAKISAQSRSNVLLIGESGTGKELFAQAIHNYSTRNKDPFIAINCGALPRELVQSELFGYEEGAFTGSKKEGHTGKFELADGGTIFLDEIGDMPLEAQVNLLRVLETREVVRVGGKYPKLVDVKVIAATNRDLPSAVADKTFREDLYYRLNVMTVNIPALRERISDIPLLVQHFINKLSKQLGKDIRGYSDKFIEQLQSYKWQGNVRELENIIERAVNVCTKEELTIQELPYSLLLNKETQECKRISILEETEQQIILSALKENEWNIRQTAIKLGLARSTLYQKMKRYNLER